MFSLRDYDYELPGELIAQKPVKKRDQSRLLFLNRRTGGLAHHAFHELTSFFTANDVLVLNNTEVIPGRLLGHKETGGRAEVLILNYTGRPEVKGAEEPRIFQCLVKASKRPKPGTYIRFNDNLRAEVIDIRNEICLVRFYCGGDFEKELYQVGKVPLPPYIRRDDHEHGCEDREAYQTVYACEKGAVAAPTAGLHLTKALLASLKAKGVSIIEITLHVGYGTFLPVRVKDIRDHRMHSERYTISPAVADVVNRAKGRGGRVVAVGTTSVRTLEFSADEAGTLLAGSGECDLYIYPGYRYKVVDAMITNFHLPKSTLLMLVSAFAGRENILNAYMAAIKERYRFFSYGDAMLIA